MSERGCNPRALVSLGGLFFIDGQGEALQRLGDREDCRLPVIFGLRREMLDEDPRKARADLARGIALIGAAERSGLNEVLPLIEVHLHDRGDVLVLENGTRIHLPLRDPVATAEHLGRVVTEAAQREEFPRVIHLDKQTAPKKDAVRLAHDRGRFTENTPTRDRLAHDRGRQKGRV